jgi:hypothetical protein
VLAEAEDSGHDEGPFAETSAPDLPDLPDLRFGQWIDQQQQQQQRRG